VTVVDKFEVNFTLLPAANWNCHVTSSQK